MLTDKQIAEVKRLKQYFPFRIVYAAISPKGEFECNTCTTKRIPNDLARKGYQVWTC